MSGRRARLTAVNADERVFRVHLGANPQERLDDRSLLPSLSGARGAALIRADLLRARMLSVLRGVLADEVGVAFLDLLDALATEEAPARIGGVYGRLFALLADEAELPPSRSSATPGRTTC